VYRGLAGITEIPWRRRECEDPTTDVLDGDRAGDGEKWAPNGHQNGGAEKKPRRIEGKEWRRRESKTAEASAAEGPGAPQSPSTDGSCTVLRLARDGANDHQDPATPRTCSNVASRGSVVERRLRDILGLLETGEVGTAVAALRDLLGGGA
jgi:hypothetical protein